MIYIKEHQSPTHSILLSHPFRHSHINCHTIIPDTCASSTTPRSFQSILPLNIVVLLLGCLSSLLWRWSVDIFANISNVMEASRSRLDTTPSLLNWWRSILRSNQAINSRLQLFELTLNKAALSESRPQESSVDSDEDPASLGESKSRQEKTTPEEDFQDSDKSHGGIIVFFDELADVVSSGVGLEGRLGGGRSPSYWGGLLRWLEGGNEVSSGVGCNVED